MRKLILKLKIAAGLVIVVAILTSAGLMGLDLLAATWDAEMEGARQVCAAYACLLPLVGTLLAIFAWRQGRKATTAEE